MKAGKHVAPRHGEEQDRQDQQHHDRDELPLDHVGNHDGNLAAKNGYRHRHGHHHEYDGGQCWDGEAEDGERFGQAGEMDQEPGADRGKDAVVENARSPREEAGEDAEFFAVTHLEELAFR